MGVIGIRILGCGVYGYKGLGFEVILITAGAIMKWRLLFHVRVAPGSEPSALNPDPGYDPCWFFPLAHWQLRTIFGPLAQVAEAAEAKAELESKWPGLPFCYLLSFVGFCSGLEGYRVCLCVYI